MIYLTNARLYQTQAHCTYTCKYHFVWTPKYRGKVLADKYIKQELKRMFKMICKWKGFIPLGWHIGDEHIHLHISIPPKYSVAYAIGLIKGKSSTWLKKKINKFPKGTLWERGYFVSTVGVNEEAIKKYIANQQHHQIDLKQTSMWDKLRPRT